jgi:hypothetical protein
VPAGLDRPPNADVHRLDRVGGAHKERHELHPA